MMINEIRCASALSDSKIPGIRYSLNPYIGCTHGCAYCYARFMEKYIKRDEQSSSTCTGASWGSFASAKMNICQLLRRELSGKQKGLVFLSSVCDPYQEAELKYELTRNCLIELAKKQWPVSVLTKSDLVLRDIDILKKMDCDVGFTVTSSDDNINKAFEPNASPASKRIAALRELKDRGIKTYVFLGPILPELTDWKAIIEQASFVDRILVDKLRIKSGNWPYIKNVVPQRLLPEWQKILFNKRSSYYKELRSEIRKACNERGIDVWFCY